MSNRSVDDLSKSDSSLRQPTRVVLEPPRGWISLDLGELWNYRELLVFLAWRDVLVRYKQSALGIGWAVVQPLMMMVIFSIIFGRFAGLPSDDIPYPLFTFAALLPWQLFAVAVQRSSGSLVSNTNLITKIFFPRLLIPVSAVAVGVVDFAVAFLVFLGMMLWFGIVPTWLMLTLPLFVLLALMFALAVSLWLSAISVRYHDVAHVVPFFIQAGLFASPVAYSSNLVPEGTWRLIYGLNPMAGAIQGFRWAVLGATPPDTMMVISVAATGLLLISGLTYFKRQEMFFADVV